jgi:hypothetical protein
MTIDLTREELYQNKIMLLEYALKFYACAKNYYDIDLSTGKGVVEQILIDKGEKAQTALSVVEKLK